MIKQDKNDFLKTIGDVTKTNNDSKSSKKSKVKNTKIGIKPMHVSHFYMKMNIFRKD